MKKIIIVLILLFIIWLCSDRIVGFYYMNTKTPEEILISQLNNQGCGYQYDCNFNWNHYSGYNVRNPNFHCPMFAARCVLKLKQESGNVMSSLKLALAKQASQFDTGDGVINYASCIQGVINSIENNTSIIPPEC